MYIFAFTTKTLARANVWEGDDYDEGVCVYYIMQKKSIFLHLSLPLLITLLCITRLYSYHHLYILLLLLLRIYMFTYTYIYIVGSCAMLIVQLLYLGFSFLSIWSIREYLKHWLTLTSFEKQSKYMRINCIANF